MYFLCIYLAKYIAKYMELFCIFYLKIKYIYNIYDV